MYLTFFRTKIGLDEEVFIKFFDSKNQNFINFDDTNYSNIITKNIFIKLVKKIFRNKLENDLLFDVKKILDNFNVTHVFIFNGKGISKKLSLILKSRVRYIYCYFPDYIKHKDIHHLEDIAKTIIFPKPATYNKIIFKDKNIKKITNIFPVFFSTRKNKLDFFKKLKEQNTFKKKYKLGFLGNFSKFKYNSLAEISKLNNTKIAVVGTGWSDDNFIVNIGPIYGNALFYFFSKVNIGIAITDSSNNLIDPITLRYFQYSMNNTMPIFYINNYNRDIFSDFQNLCFENFVEASDRINYIDNLNSKDYKKLLNRVNNFFFKNLKSVEDLMASLNVK